MNEPWFRVGLRVPDVQRAAAFYEGLGFDRVGAIPGPTGEPVMTILQRGEVLLLIDALVGMPFPDSDRERQVQAGPRGLGVAIGMRVIDLAAAHDYCVENGCTITAPPADQPWGDRVFEFLDPFGYLWEISKPHSHDQVSDALEATRQSWFGSPARVPS